MYAAIDSLKLIWDCRPATAWNGTTNVRSSKSIAEGNLKHRVSIGKEGAEIENLAITFNEMIYRIQCLIDEMNEVTNSIAHDLRNLITRIRLMAEQSLEQNTDTDSESFHDTSVLIIEECDRLVQMIKTMLAWIIHQYSAASPDLCSNKPISSQHISVNENSLSPWNFL